MPAINFADAAGAYANAGRMAGTQGAGQAAGSTSFGEMLRNTANSVVDTIAGGEKASMQAVQGKADLAQVTQAVSNSEIAVQSVVAVRDRVVQAYQDIMRMPI